ncbi:glucan 1,4-alpha-glucosidase [Halarchaeum grantii]|uniref:Glucan 1,4-alpha-glucosidase n=1 Tax=Halarchaeum grantii TaxID=1193105 RepID=A0A830F2M5_9EURY|nr:glucodextranase DOMON-like domain-containing protein [Halarchaeum grantii]GGL34550.1 glucan 1,4-alpha-glucosidase [Halarchaeum grantii]
MRDSDLSRRSWLKTVGAGAAAAALGTGVGAAERPVPTGGADAYWTTGEQYGVGTVPDHGAETRSRVWYTLTEGALAQVRFPRVDFPSVRTLDFVVAAPDESYAARTHEVDRTDDDPVERSVEPSADDALLFEQTARDPERGWELAVEYAATPDGDAVLADVRFDGAGGEYDVYALCDLALSESGMGDAASVHTRSTARGKAEGHGNETTGHESYALTASATGAYDDSAVVLDENGDPYHVAAALASRRGFDWGSVDVVGGDAVRPLLADGAPDARHANAEGNAVLVGRLGSGVARLDDTVALGFAANAEEERALAEARRGLKRDFAATRAHYRNSWREWLRGIDTPDAVAGDDVLEPQYHFAAMTLKAAESKQFPGAGLAALCVPWGGEVRANGPSDYGYNFVWARDLYQSATAFEAMGDVEAATAAIEYVYEYQQQDDGFVPQNTFIDGRTRWGGEQLDEHALPGLLVHQLVERYGLTFDDVAFDYADVKATADYLAANGPVTGQERWEEEGGLSPSTVAAEIAGLVAAAHLADGEGERGDALVYLALADHWRANTAEWMATEEGTERHTETPYYVRVTDDDDPDDGAARALANGGPTLDERDVIDAGFLELVRLGVAPADDPVVENSVAVVDDTLRVETPHGPAFYRYNGDGYGEQAGENYPPGAPWSLDNAGKGRLWPIFTGERAEYELLAGNEDPEALLRTMAGFANTGRMLPEQVWDREEPTAYGWTFGEGTGSATPLSWSMAQFVRLAHSINAGEPVERPASVAARYTEGETPEGPALDVEFPPKAVGSRDVTVSGTTEGAEVVVQTPVETVTADVSDGSFSVDVRVAAGESAITVVAATGGAVTDAGTTVAQRTVAYLDVGDLVAEFDDPAGDDHGPGDYTYPTAGAFGDGAFDVDSVAVYETADSYQFLTTLGGDLTNPWGGRGFSLQTFQFYVSDPDATGGTTDARTGVNATFEAPYQRRVVAEGWVAPVVEDADGATLTTDVSVTAYSAIDAVLVDVPKYALGGSLDGKRLAALLCPQAGSQPGRIRQVSASNGPYSIGGAENANAPNVVDLVTPDGVTNADALAYTATEKATIPYVDL